MYNKFQYFIIINYILISQWFSENNQKMPAI